MSKLEGNAICIKIPYSVLEKTGNIEGTETARSFYEQMLERIDNILTDEQKKLVNKVKSHYFKISFMPAILENMIKNNSTLSEAIEASKFNIWLTNMKFSKQIKTLEDNEPEEINTVIKCILEPLIKGSTTKVPNGSFCYLNLDCTSPALSNIIKHSGAYSIAEFVANNATVRKEILQKIVSPLNESMYNALINAKEKHDLDDEFLSDISTSLIPLVDELYINIPLGSVLSIILTKALNEDLTFDEALESFEKDVLTATAIEESKTFIDVSNLAETYQQLIESIFDMLI